MAENSKNRLFFLILVLAVSLVGGGYYFYRQMPSGRMPTIEKEDFPAQGPSDRGVEKAAAELFFSSRDGSALVSERRPLPQSSTIPEQCGLIIEELKKGSRNKLLPLLPMQMDVRTIFLLDTVLVVDLEPAVKEASAGTYQESLIWYSIVNSIIMNVKGIEAVHFLVDGQEADTILGHMDMRGAFEERLDLVRWF